MELRNLKVFLSCFLAAGVCFSEPTKDEVGHREPYKDEVDAYYDEISRFVDQMSNEQREAWPVLRSDEIKDLIAEAKRQVDYISSYSKTETTESIATGTRDALNDFERYPHSIQYSVVLMDALYHLYGIAVLSNYPENYKLRVIKNRIVRHAIALGYFAEERLISEYKK